MNNQGWIKIYRQLMDTSFYRNSAVVHLFIHLLIMSNHKKHKFLLGGEEIEVDEGQLVTGRETLSEQTGISVQTIRTCLEALESTNTITIKTTNRYSVITIQNWKNFQGVTSNQPAEFEAKKTLGTTNQPTEFEAKDKKTRHELTSNQPTTNQQLTTYKNDKNDKNDKNNTPVIFKKTSDVREGYKKMSANRLLNLVGNPVLCKVQDTQRGCGKCAWCSLTVLTPQQIYELAVEKKIGYEDVKRTHDSLIAWIQDGRMKSKTVYRTLATWIDNSIMRGDIRELGFMELEMMDLKYNTKLRKQLDEIHGRLERGEIKL